MRPGYITNLSVPAAPAIPHQLAPANLAARLVVIMYHFRTASKWSSKCLSRSLLIVQVVYQTDHIVAREGAILSTYTFHQSMLETITKRPIVKRQRGVMSPLARERRAAISYVKWTIFRVTSVMALHIQVSRCLARHPFRRPRRHWDTRRHAKDLACPSPRWVFLLLFPQAERITQLGDMFWRSMKARGVKADPNDGQFLFRQLASNQGEPSKASRKKATDFFLVCRFPVQPVPCTLGRKICK